MKGDVKGNVFYMDKKSNGEELAELILKRVKSETSNL